MGSVRSAGCCRLPHLLPGRRIAKQFCREGTSYACLAVRADPSKASARQQRDAVLRPKIRRVWDDNWKVYGARKAWRQLCREGETVARCTVARLMAGMGLRGIVRGKAMKTTIPDTSVPCPRDKVNRKFRASAPNMLCPLLDTVYRLPGNRSATSPMSQRGRDLFMLPS